MGHGRSIGSRTSENTAPENAPRDEHGDRPDIGLGDDLDNGLSTPTSQTATSQAAAANPKRLRIGSWTVDPQNGCFIDGEKEVRLGTKAMAVLTYLIGRAGQVSAKDDIIRTVWNGKAVSDDALSVSVYELRKALGDNARAPRFIETVPGRGYRWLHAAELEAAPAKPANPLPTRSPAQLPTQQPAQPSTGIGAEPDPGSTDARRIARWLGLTAITLLVVLGISASWPRSSSKPAPLTIAVLPLADDSAQPPPNRALADGMTGALIQSLARLMPLQVISRTSISRFKPPTTESAPEIARELGADLLLEGSVQRLGQAIRLDLRLIDSRIDRQLWASTYNANLGDWKTMQWEMATRVAREIRVHSGIDEVRGAEPRPHDTPLDPDAIDAYLLGRHSLSEVFAGFRAGEHLENARDAFARTVALAPSYEEGHIGLALVYATMRWMGVGDPATATRRARDAASEALRLDPRSARAHMALGEFHVACSRDLDAAEATFREALRLDPADGEIDLACGWMLRMRRRFTEAEQMAYRAHHLDPLALGPLRLLASVLYEDGRPNEALAHVDRLDELVPGAGQRLRAQSLIDLGRDREAFDAYREYLASVAPELNPDILDETYDRGGFPAFFAALREHERPPSLDRAILSMRAGDADLALEILIEATRNDDPGLMLVYASPALVPLHSDPRFRMILEHYGLLPSYPAP